MGAGGVGTAVAESSGSLPGSSLGGLLGWSVWSGWPVGVWVWVGVGAGVGTGASSAGGSVWFPRLVPEFPELLARALPTLVPCPLLPSSTEESGLPSTPSTPVRTARLSTSAAAAVQAVLRQLECPTGSAVAPNGSGPRSGAPGSRTGARAGGLPAGRTTSAVRRTTSRLRWSDAEYVAVAMVATTLATAAPMMVPATPRYDAANAADAAARALTASWVRLNEGRSC